MSKKICHWLNSKKQGNISLTHGNVLACCTRALVLCNNIDYAKIDYDDLQNRRKKLFEDINSDHSPCDGCNFLEETEEKNIDIGKLGYIIYHPHSTCNLRCIYCTYTKDNSVADKFEKDKYNPYKDAVHFHEIGLLKEDVTFEFGGGEPLLLDKLPETINFLSQTYPKSSVTFVSNFSLHNKNLIDALKTRKIKSCLKTSIDCGTRETYKKIRGRDLFDTVRTNLLNAAKNNAFDEIILKYIFMEDCSNASNKDVEGFIKLVKEVNKNNPNKTSIIVDADVSSIFESNFKKDIISDKILKAAAKIITACKYDMLCEIKWNGERFSYGRPEGRNHINKILEFSKNSFASKLYIIKNFFKICKKVIKLLYLMK